MNILKVDPRTDMKLAIDDEGGYLIWMMNNWNKIDASDVETALKIFHRVSDNHYVDEMKRNNTLPIG